MLCISLITVSCASVSHRMVQIKSVHCHYFVTTENDTIQSNRRIVSHLKSGYIVNVKTNDTVNNLKFIVK